MNRFGKIRNRNEKRVASLPGIMIIFPLNIPCTAHSPALSDFTAIFLPNHPNCLMVSILMEGFVNTGPGQTQLTEMLFSFRRYFNE